MFGDNDKPQKKKNPLDDDIKKDDDYKIIDNGDTQLIQKTDQQTLNKLKEETVYKPEKITQTKAELDTKKFFDSQSKQHQDNIKKSLQKQESKLSTAQKLTLEDPKLNSKLKSKQKKKQKTKIDLSDEVMQKIRAIQNPEITLNLTKPQTQKQRIPQVLRPQKQTTKADIDKLQKKKQEAETRFSLVVKHGSRQKEELDEKYGITTTPAFTFRIDEEITTKRPPPVITGIKLLGIDGTKNSKNQRRNGKLKKGFYRWNVDTERVGVYLPTADLHTGRTDKVIKRVDRLQAKTHTKKYLDTKQKRHGKFWTMKLKSESDTDLFAKKSGNSLFTRKVPTRKPPKKKKSFWDFRI